MHSLLKFRSIQRSLDPGIPLSKFGRFGGSWISPSKIQTNSVVRGFLHPPLKILTDSAVRGSLHMMPLTIVGRPINTILKKYKTAKIIPSRAREKSRDQVGTRQNKVLLSLVPTWSRLFTRDYLISRQNTRDLVGTPIRD